MGKGMEGSGVAGSLQKNSRAAARTTSDARGDAGVDAGGGAVNAEGTGREGEAFGA